MANTDYKNFINDVAKLKASYNFSPVDGWCGYNWIYYVRDTNYGEDIYNDKEKILKKTQLYQDKINEVISEMKSIISEILRLDNFYEKLFNTYFVDVNSFIDRQYSLLFNCVKYKEDNELTNEVLMLKNKLVNKMNTLKEYRAVVACNRVFLHYYKINS